MRGIRGRRIANTRSSLRASRRPEDPRTAGWFGLPSIRVLACVLALAMLVAGRPARAAPPAAASPQPFVETFDGRPDHPQPWHPDNWDVTIHSRDRETFYNLEPMDAGHSAHCGAPPAMHHVDSYEDAVFQCNDHVMTAIKAGGYGVIYLTPNQLVDFSDGEAVIRFDMSTLRTSFRDWIDLWITPYDEELQLPLDRWLPDLNGEPRDAIHIKMNQVFSSGGNAQTVFGGEVIRGFDVQDVPANAGTGYESFLTPSATRRDTFELHISRTHLKFGMPAHNFWWINADIRDLGWSRGVVQFGHHSYNPAKDCTPSGTLTCTANTWHWDNVQISRALPFTMLHADRRYVDQNSGSAVVFPAPAPENAHLRFVGIGNVIQASYDDGATWQGVDLQQQLRYGDGNFRSYWTPIPAGTTSVRFRGEGWYGGPWMVRDVSIWALDPAIGAACPGCPAP